MPRHGGHNESHQTTSIVSPEVPVKSSAIRSAGACERQVAGVRAMVEVDRYCIDVLQEINAAKQSLETVALVSGHVRMAGGDAGNRDLNARELKAAVGRLVKTA